MLVASIIVCQLKAQPETTLPNQTSPVTHGDKFVPQTLSDQTDATAEQTHFRSENGQLFSVRRQVPRRDGFEQRAVTLGADFGKALGAAIQDEVIKPEQADQMLKELEAEVAISRARLELLRAIAILDKATDGAPQPGELQRLRNQLKQAVSTLQPRSQPTLKGEINLDTPTRSEESLPIIE